MKKELIHIREGMMLCAAGLLVVMMLTVLLRFATVKILVQSFHIHNWMTEEVLYDTDLQNADVPPRLKKQKIYWSELYPFECDETEKKEIRLIKVIEAKVKVIKEKIEKWTAGRYLFGYFKLVEIGRSYEDYIGWKLINPKHNTLNLGNGYWTFINKKLNTKECAKSVIQLAAEVERNGSAFLYVQVPPKIDKNGEPNVNGKLDFSNSNFDVFLDDLRNGGIDTLDLREYAYEISGGDDYYEMFFRTDHHWRPEAALRAAKVVGNRIVEYGIAVDDKYWNLSDFDIEVLPAFFLGNCGEKETLARVVPDDFPVLHPKFPTHIRFVVPEWAIDLEGDFECSYDKEQVARRGFYYLSPYCMYGHGNGAVMNITNKLLSETEEKVLIIRDSYCNTMGPFMALGIRNVMLLDLREFTGSVREYIRKEKPNVVIVMYSDLSPEIDWSSHKDMFDFR